MIGLLILNCVSFSLLGFILGILSNNFEQLNLVPMLIITPLVLGGSFYSIEMLPSFWRTVTLFNPAVYLLSGLRWAFFGISDIPIEQSLLAMVLFCMICLLVIF